MSVLFLPRKGLCVGCLAGVLEPTRGDRAGHTNRGIVDQLYVPVRTVESHRKHILEKVRLSRHAELVHYALSRGSFSRE